MSERSLRYDFQFLDTAEGSSWLREFVRQVLQGRSTDEVIEYTVHRIAELLPQYRVAYGTVDSAGILTVLCSVEPGGMSGIKGLSSDLSVAPKYLNELRQGKPVIVEDTSTDDRVAPLSDALAAGSTRSIVDVPIVHEEQVVGILCLDSSKPQSWQERDVTPLCDIAEFVRQAIEHERQGLALETSEEQYRTLVETTSDIVCRHSADGFITFINSAGERITGFTREEVVGHHITEFIAPDALPELEKRKARRMAGNTSPDFYEVDLIARDGVRIPVNVSATPLMEHEAFAGMLLVARDISEWRRIREEQQRSEAERAELFRSIRDAIIVVDAQERIVDCNEAFSKLFGYAREEALGSTPDSLFADQSEFVWVKRQIAHHRGDDHFFPIIRFRTHDGREFIGEDSTLVRSNEQGEHVATVHLIRDVTGRINTEQRAQTRQKEIERLLEEKELLIREVHHRIKNDMSAIQSLLSLQANSVANISARDALLEARNRVTMMGGIYDDLYRQSDFAEVDAALLIERLTAEIGRTLPSADRAIIDTKVSETRVPSKVAFPLGIIVNELVTNSLKYAFAGFEREGRIAVSLTTGSDGRLHIKVSDNGTGIPAEKLEQKKFGFGLTLVQAFAAQHGGTLNLRVEDGTIAEVDLIPGNA